MILPSMPENPIMGLVSSRDEMIIATPRATGAIVTDDAASASFARIFRAILVGSEIAVAPQIASVHAQPAENAQGKRADERLSDSGPMPEDTLADTPGPEPEPEPGRDHAVLAEDLIWGEDEPILPTHPAVPAVSGVSASDHPEADVAWVSSARFAVAQETASIAMPALAPMQMSQPASASMAGPLLQDDQQMSEIGRFRPPQDPHRDNVSGYTSKTLSLGSAVLPVGDLPHNNTALREADFGGSRFQTPKETNLPIAAANVTAAQGVRFDGVGSAPARRSDQIGSYMENDRRPNMRMQTTPAPTPAHDIYTFSTGATAPGDTPASASGASVPITVASAPLPPLQPFVEPPETLPLQTLPGVSGSANAQAGGAFGGPQAPHVAASAAAQIAIAVSGDRTGSTDIRLSPQELGRVRLNLVTHDSAIAVAIIAERPETADLMRRHIDILAQEFRAMGFDDVTFSFADERSGARDREQTEKEAGDTQIAAAVSEDVIVENRKAAGLDLRL